MADIAASDFTVTVQERRREGKKHVNKVKLVFGNDTLTYPAGGIPLPAYGALGLRRNVEYIRITDANDALGHIWKYDQESHKLRCYVQGVLVGAAGAATLDDFPVTAGDGVTASLSMSFNNNAGAGTQLFGTLKEMATGDAPAAQTIYIEAVGW